MYLPILQRRIGKYIFELSPFNSLHMRLLRKLD
jgi:hypothetical protein